VGHRGPAGKKDRGLRQPEVTWFGVGHRGSGGEKERGLRVQSPNQAPGEVLTGKGSDKEDAMLEKTKMI